MKIDFNPLDKTYTLSSVTETELQVLHQAFMYGTPFSDIAEIYLFSRRVREQLEEAVSDLVERYR